MTTLVLWRHSRTGYNAAGRLQGSLDIPLGPEGQEQARRAAGQIVSAYGAHLRVVSSPLVRARASALELAKLVSVPVEVQDALTQRSYGVWEGLTGAEVSRRWPQEWAAKQRGEDPSIDGWGKAADVSARVGKALRALAGDARPTVVVSHGSAIQLGLLNLLELVPTSRILGHVPHAAWSVVTQSESGAWHLEHYGLGAP
ncbi:histidine phosphatase family protein [Demequina globuliformis]|uniref:histidine phosphatase family protein n=1 Tax=Demequina globuliformis TaxID=676202 RepID=UPI0007803590|nr:histidine phosphatase family protein [Demequina globuliformis]